MTWVRAVAVLACALVAPLTFAKDRFINGQVVTVGKNDEETPVAGLDVAIKEDGNSDKTKANGKFLIFLPDAFKPGEKVTIQVAKKGWRIWYPLGGEARIVAKPEKAVEVIKLLEVGSKRFWSADRIEKVIADTAERAREQVKPQGSPKDIDFSHYIKDWAVQLGFSALEAKEQIDKWIAEVEQKQEDERKRSLAEYAKRNFGRAFELATESAEAKVKQKEALQRRELELSRDIVRDYRLAGDAAYAGYAFDGALQSYELALNELGDQEAPPLRAAIQLDIGTAAA